MKPVHKVTLIEGDGIGPEVVSAARKIIEATSVQIEWEACEAGAKVFKKGRGDHGAFHGNAQAGKGLQSRLD